MGDEWITYDNNIQKIMVEDKTQKRWQNQDWRQKKWCYVCV